MMQGACRSRFVRLAAALGAALWLASWPAAAGAAEVSADVPVVAAASDLQYALPELAAAFSRASGLEVKLALGSSGNFARQIIQGAPFQVFFSADEDYVRELAARSLTLDRGSVYAVGRLALYVPAGSAVAPDAQMNDLAAAAADGRLRRLAIANPDHAPYGRAAREALTRKGLWRSLQGRLVLGENVSQAAQFARSGSAEAGLIARSLAISGPMARRGSFALVPQKWHAPLRQRMVLLRGAGRTARQFYAYAQGAPARAVFERHGFALPGAAH